MVSVRALSRGGGGGHGVFFLSHRFVAIEPSIKGLNCPIFFGKFNIESVYFGF